MKRLLSFILIILSVLLLIGCSTSKPKPIEQESYERISTLTNILELSSSNEDVIRVLIITNSDFVTWVNQDISQLSNEVLFDLFITWYELPQVEEEIIEELLEEPIIEEPTEEPIMPELKFYEIWGITTSSYDGYLDHVFVFIKDGSVLGVGYSASTIDWDTHGIPIPVPLEMVNQETFAHEEYALNYWQEHFNSPNADYQLP